MTITTMLPLFTLVLFILFLLLSYALFTLSQKIKKLTGGAKAEHFEHIVIEAFEKVKQLEKDLEIEKEKVSFLSQKITKAVSMPSLLRYKAFEGNASTQSFSLALLNERGEGAVVSSLHVRDRISIYAKKISHFESEVELTEEEKTVIRESRDAQQK